VDENKRPKTFSIVGMNETNSSKNFISWKSPIGRALLGKQVGDEVLIQTPKGEIEYTILQVQYLKLEMGEFQC